MVLLGSNEETHIPLVKSIILLMSNKRSNISAVKQMLSISYMLKTYLFIKNNFQSKLLRTCVIHWVCLLWGFWARIDQPTLSHHPPRRFRICDKNPKYHKQIWKHKCWATLNHKCFEKMKTRVLSVYHTETSFAKGILICPLHAWHRERFYCGNMYLVWSYTQSPVENQQ